MLRILISLIFLSIQSFASESREVDLIKPLHLLFSHKAHENLFEKTDTSCTTCHTFSIKAVSGDPLDPGVPSGLLKVKKNVCHECHMGKVSVPRPNQCTLCHSHVEKLIPDSHKLNWKSRHGTFAQADPDSCKECHGVRSCTQCHTQRDNLKPAVHRPNFRLTHSIEARANPQSCVVCHSNTSYCLQCHTKGMK